jgi:hypothetical protein
MLNAIEAGTLNATDLQTLLTADAGRLAELNTLFSLRGQMRRAMQSVTPRTAIFGSAAALNAMVTNFDAMQTVAASQTAMTAIAASQVAMDAIAASQVAMNAIAASQLALDTVIASTLALNTVVASQVAMDAVTASQFALDTVIASTVVMTAIAGAQAARLAFFNSDIALAAVFNDSNARDILRASAAYGVVTTSSAAGSTSRAIPVPDTAGSYIVLGYSTSDADLARTITISTLRAGSFRPAAVGTSIAGVISSTAALGNIATPLVSPFNAVSTDISTQTFSFGLLRCDV